MSSTVEIKQSCIIFEVLILSNQERNYVSTRNTMNVLGLHLSEQTLDDNIVNTRNL
jgi:hypothetical protein